MPELPRVDSAGARRLCGENYTKGLAYYRDGSVSNVWRTTGVLYGAVAGSAKEPYQASLAARADGSFEAHCSCPAARRQSMCKHAAALLIAWSEKPDSFALRAEPEGAAAARPKLESEAKRTREPKADRRDLIATGLDKAEALLIDLCSQGLLSVTAEQVAAIGSLAEVLEAHKLRRMARQVAEIQGMVNSSRGNGAFDERAWARLLGDSWFILSATRRALEKGENADQSELEDLVGKTWLEKELQMVSDLRMVELAYQTAVLPTGFRVETSYLLDLGDGTLYTEKQITPLRLKNTPRKRSYTQPLQVASAGIYPGFAPHRVKLIEVEEMADGGQAWDRAAGLAETSVAAFRQRLIQATASLVAPQEVYSLLRPASILSEGESIYLLDAEGKALAFDRERRAGLHGLRGAMARVPLDAVFCRVRFAGDSVVAEPLSAIARHATEGGRLIRLTA